MSTTEITINNDTLKHYLLSDQALSSILLDQIDFIESKAIAKKIVNIVETHRSVETSSSIKDKLDSSFNIALYGSWGSGKTTILNEIEDIFKEKNIQFVFLILGNMKTLQYQLFLHY